MVDKEREHSQFLLRELHSEELAGELVDPLEPLLGVPVFLALGDVLEGVKVFFNSGPEASKERLSRLV